MHKGLEVKMGNLYTDRALPNENHSWVYTLKGRYSTWDDFFRHAYKLAVKHQIINEEHLMNITHDNATEAYFQAHPHHVQLLKDMEQTEKETKEIVRQIAEETKALKEEVKEKTMSTVPFPSIPTLPDKKTLSKATQKQTYADWNIRIYATDKTITAHTRYIVLLKHKDTKVKQWYYPKDRGFLSIEEAYAAAVICIAHKKNYILFRFQDCELLTVSKNEE
jgi:hypothetical protein